MTLAAPTIKAPSTSLAAAGIFTPFPVRGVTFRNRIVVTPMCQYASTDGYIARWHRSHHGRFALGGVGGAIVESTGITSDGRITTSCLGIYKDTHIDGLKEIVGIYHDHGIPVGIQLNHAGRKGSAAAPRDGAAPLGANGWPTLAPSAVAMAEGWPIPQALDDDGIEQVFNAFENAGGRAVAAGFDFVEIHGAHGYLINSFFSPLSNRRTDAWGGDLTKRMAFPLAVARRLRALLPSTMPLFYRTSAVDGVEGGVTIEDTVALARSLKEAGVDLIDCSSGGILGSSGISTTPAGPGYLVPFSSTVRRDAAIATMAVGLITKPEQADDIVRSGKADLVAMGRQLLADPNFAYRAAVALGHTDPECLLPAAYAFFLRRRPRS